MDTETKKFFLENPDILEHEIAFWERTKLGAHTEEHLTQLVVLRTQLNGE